MARGVRFLLGFRQYPFLKKTDRVYPFLAIAHDINIYLVLRMYVRNDYQETTMRNPRRTDKCHNLCSDVLYTSKSLRQQTAETTS